MPKATLPLKAEKRGVFKLGKVPLSKLRAWSAILKADSEIDFEAAMRQEVIRLIDEYGGYHVAKSTHTNGSSPVVLGGNRTGSID